MSLRPKKNIIRNDYEFDRLYKTSLDFSDKVFENINFLNKPIDWTELKLKNTAFLGCKFRRKTIIDIIEKGGFVYPRFKDAPYKPYRKELYTWQELMAGYEEEKDNSVDLNIYNNFVENKYNPPVNEALAQRIHDSSIDDALRELIKYDENGMTEKKCVGFMGGHSTARGSEFYVKTAFTAKYTAEAGYFVVSGGGPGIMEAANLGAYFSNYSDADLNQAIALLSDLEFSQENLPDYKASNYIIQSKKVLEKYPNGADTLAIPTWFYGHEPSNLFASHIAKYFSNSIREDILLAISLYGVVFAPGSAGTTQEIFQEAAQNHYATFGYYSPMVFLSKERYVENTSLYSVLHQLATGQPYKSLLHLTNTPIQVVNFLKNHPPIKK